MEEKMGRRNRLEILGCILNICREDGSSKTKIVYQINLNFKNAGLYIEWLIAHGYLTKEDKLYRTTPSGQRLMENLNDISPIITDRTVGAGQKTMARDSCSVSDTHKLD
jgi:predicted transcriptional regulator